MELRLNYTIPTPAARQLELLEEAIQRDLEPVDLDALTHHHFAPGVYVRELRIPAGTVLTGKRHRYETMNILLQGTIRVTTDDGMRTLHAPQIFNSKPGTKKAGFAVTDTVWLNVHATEETDLDAIEHQFIIPEQIGLGQEDRICLGEQ